MDKYETKCKYNIAETCCASVSLDQLQELCEDKNTPLFQTSQILNYGAIRGSDALRANLARLYSAKGNTLSPESILTTAGAIQANYLCAYALVGPGDHVICHYPTCKSRIMSLSSRLTLSQISPFMRSPSSWEQKSTSGMQRPRMTGYRG